MTIIIWKRILNFGFSWFKCDSEDPNSCGQLPATYDARLDGQGRYPNSSFQQVTDPATGDKVKLSKNLKF